MPTKTKEGALKAARKLYGAEAIEGVDFTLSNTGAGWDHKPVPAANEPAKVARAKRQAVPVPEPKSFAPAGETKTDMLTRMMSTPDGATSAEMEEATGWAPHSVRGLLGALRKRGISIDSHKAKGGPTVYRIAVGDVI